ncbi:MAG: ribosome-associated translation inhibitor RaiA [Bacteroidetes bacterium]|jgi:putative sigma-54 modulation protein|nr:ribosomal subunit interface protein [Crocinitomicaceae bacterium]MCH9822106.1 ribosome-associated translation inhibitor RaiA [Bacteroidota bacterium]|tara:strand:- start:414 stop:713 length:300 start_codon:yes stop_codon:yes gene_type:complete
MKVKIHSIHFDADSKLETFIVKRLDKLDQYFDNIIEGEVFLKLDNADDNQNKITEIKLLVPGGDLFVKKQCKSFEESTDLAVEALRRQVKKYKEKKRQV